MDIEQPSPSRFRGQEPDQPPGTSRRLQDTDGHLHKQCRHSCCVEQIWPERLNHYRHYTILHGLFYQQPQNILLLSKRRSSRLSYKPVLVTFHIKVADKQMQTASRPFNRKTIDKVETVSGNGLTTIGTICLTRTPYPQPAGWKTGIRAEPPTKDVRNLRQAIGPTRTADVLPARVCYRETRYYQRTKLSGSSVRHLQCYARPTRCVDYKICQSTSNNVGSQLRDSPLLQVRKNRSCSVRKRDDVRKPSAAANGRLQLPSMAEQQKTQVTSHNEENLQDPTKTRS